MTIKILLLELNVSKMSVLSLQSFFLGACLYTLAVPYSSVRGSIEYG